jgi:phosphoglycolate phosphatase
LKGDPEGSPFFSPDVNGYSRVVKLVLFDIDGTLIRTGGAGVQAFGQTFAEVFNLKDATRTLQFAGRTDVSLVREGLRLHGIEPNEENIARFFAVYPRHLQHFLERLPARILPGMTEFLNALLALPQRPIVGLLTGNVRRGAELKLRHLGLWERFETGAFADVHEDRNCIAAKAKERGEELMRHKLAGEEIVVIGDTPHDITCARSIGAKVLAVATGVHTREELASKSPNWAVEQIGQVTLDEVIGSTR